MSYRFTAFQPLRRKLQRFATENMLNSQRHRAAMRALDFLFMAELAYGHADRRRYLAKAQSAFRLAFV